MLPIAYHHSIEDICMDRVISQVFYNNFPSLFSIIVLHWLDRYDLMVDPNSLHNSQNGLHNLLSTFQLLLLVRKMVDVLEKENLDMP